MTTATVGRPRTPLDVAEAQALARIATLAAQIMVSLREPGRGVYESERALQAFLSKDGVSYTTADLRPALALLESAGRIGRSPAKKNTPRRGWLITAPQNGVDHSTVDAHAPEDAVEEALAEPVTVPEDAPAEAVNVLENTAEDTAGKAVEAAQCAPEERRAVLVKAVFRALESGNGRSNRCTVEDLPERLEQDGVTFTPSQLSETLMRLEDCGQILRVQRQPGYPQYLVGHSRHPYDRTDALAADVCASIKRRGDRFEDEDQLMSWLDEDKVSYDAHSLADALHQLESIGRLMRPRADQWRSDSPLPGLYVEPRVYVE